MKKWILLVFTAFFFLQFSVPAEGTNKKGGGAASTPQCNCTLCGVNVPSPILKMISWQKNIYRGTWNNGTCTCPVDNKVQTQLNKDGYCAKPKK